MDLVPFCFQNASLALGRLPRRGISNPIAYSASRSGMDLGRKAGEGQKSRHRGRVEAEEVLASLVRSGR